MSKELGQVIATRELDCADRTVVVSIGAPQAFDDGSSFYCTYEIRGLSAPRRSRVGGADSVQALILALQMIGTDLYTSEEWKSGRLRWLDMEDLGFPVPDSVRDITGRPAGG